MTKTLAIVTALMLSGFLGNNKTASMPMAGPAQTPVSSPAPSMAPVAPAVPAPVPTPMVPAAQAYEKEAAQIEASMQKIDATKQATKQLLADLETQINGAQQKIAEAKKFSFDILRSGTEQEAQAQFGKIQAILTETQNIQNSAQTDVTKKFNDNVAEIKAQVAVIENILNTLQAQGAFATTQPMQAPAPQAKMPEPEKPLLTKIGDLVANTVAYGIYGIKKAIDWIMEPPADDKKKSPDTSRPAPTPGPIVPAPLGQTAKDKLAAHITLVTQISQTLDQIKVDLTLKFQNIVDIVNALYARIQAFAPLTQRLGKKAGPAQDMSGKEIIMHIVSKTIDLTILSVTAVKDLIIKTYRRFVAPAAQQFAQDVSKKLGAIDKDTEKK